MSKTVSGAKAYLSDLVAVEIVKARFNVHFIVPQVDRCKRI